MASQNPRAAVRLTADQITEDRKAWIEVMPTIDKARNGSQFFTITREDLDAVVASIAEKADRAQIDYDHAAIEKGDTRAAGWFTGQAKVIEVGDSNPHGEVQDHDSVWAEVQWTPKAQQEIKDGEWRFVSAEWVMENRDQKSGLWTKFKEWVAATLTNRPFFDELAPVTAKDLAGSREQLEAFAAEHDVEVQELMFVLAAHSPDEKLETILGAVWTTAYINDLPDSSFLHIESGGEKDSEGKTAPRSLRHFPVKDASGKVDLPHVRNALSRAPQSNLPADVKERVANAARRLLNTTASKEDEVDGEVLKALGLKEDASSEEIILAVTELKEKVAITESFDRSVLEQLAKTTARELETDRQLARLQRDTAQKQHERDREDLLAKGVEEGRILPVHKDSLRAVYDATSDGPEKVKAIIDASPARTWNEHGTGGEGAEDEPEVREIRDDRGNLITAVVDDAWLDRKAKQILAENGKTLKTATADEYADALSRARALAAR